MRGKIHREGINVDNENRSTITKWLWTLSTGELHKKLFADGGQC